MVHVLDLLGCIANGPTTDEALAAAPDAIRAYLRFLKAHGEDVNTDEPFSTEVAQHVTEGMWLGNGSPYLMFAPDLEPAGEAELQLWLSRFTALRGALASWAETQSDADLDSAPARGRTARSILMHVLGVRASYVSPVLGGVAGVSSVVTAAERGELPLAEALRQTASMLSAAVRGATPEQRSGIIERGQIARSLRKGVRRMLEHDWEHLAELSRRPGGPEI